MKVNGEEILGFYVCGEESGTLTTKPLKTLKECYDFIQEDKRICKEYTRGMMKDVYYIEIETKEHIYTGYTLKKYKNRYWLKVED